MPKCRADDGAAKDRRNHTFAKSSRVGISPVILVTITERSSSLSRLRMISPKPNMPIATVTKPIPSASSGIPKGKTLRSRIDVGADQS